MGHRERGEKRIDDTQFKRGGEKGWLTRRETICRENRVQKG